LNELPEVQAQDVSRFYEDIVSHDRPIVIRQAVAEWNSVQSCSANCLDILDYLQNMDAGQHVYTIAAPPEANGRFFYGPDLRSLNFRRGQIPLSQVLQQLQSQSITGQAHSIAVQAMSIREAVPEFEERNPAPFLAPAPAPTMWIGTRGRVSPHYDVHRNLACVVAGSRRFILYPPDQVENLYPGPALNAPGGVPISLVDPDAPDIDRFPKYKHAESSALEATLQAGDAIYIPALWWHAVNALDTVNVLVNYWWGGIKSSSISPNDSLLHSMLSISKLDASQREAWKQFFDYYVFRLNEDPGKHLPDDLKDIVTTPDEEQIQALKNALAQRLKS
jgi:Cupin-like domain